MYITDCGILHKILWTQPAPIEIPESMKIKGKWQDSTEYKESNLNIKKMNKSQDREYNFLVMFSSSKA